MARKKRLFYPKRDALGEKLAVEQEYSGEALRAFEELLSSEQWPATSEQAAFLLRERLRWAAAVCDLLDKTPRSVGCLTLRLPDNCCLKDKLIFLTGDFYDAISCFPKKWWDGSSFEGH